MKLSCTCIFLIITFITLSVPPHILPDLLSLKYNFKLFFLSFSPPSLLLSLPSLFPSSLNI